MAVALFGLLYALYLLTYSGVFNSDDERFIFDTTESIVERGTLYLNQTTYIRPYRTSGVEPAQPFLATPLYWLADRVGHVGNVQATFLFNPLVTALTAVVLFYFALSLGYRRREALVGGLLFGAATIAWPYTKTFFREPLASLTLLAAFYFVHRWRQGLWQDAARVRSLGWLAAGVMAFTISAFTKEAALIAAPVVVAYALPPVDVLRRNRRALLALGVAALSVAALLMLGLTLLWTVQAMPGRYAIADRLYALREESLRLGPGITGFLLSPGKSVFVFSPVTLLALVALFLREPEQRRERWLAVGMLLTFVVLYAAVQGREWYGGTGWGPRYLVPVTPVLVLSGLPAVRRALDGQGIFPKVGLGLLVLLSVLVQIPGLLINMHDYYAVISPLGPGAAWTIAVWQVKYTQIVGHLRLIGRTPLDLAWTRPRADWLALGVLALGAAIFGGTLLWLARRPPGRRATVMAGAGGLALMIGLTGLALYRSYDDPYFIGDVPELHQLRVYLEQEAAPQDPILLSNPAYVNFFANYYKGDSTWYTMPRSPGERHSEEEAPQVVSENPEDLVSPKAVRLMRFVNESAPGRPLWLVVDGGPFTPWNPRPPEWWAAEAYYTVQTQEFLPTVRLVEYLSLRAPLPDTPPARERGDRLGDSIVLAGYDLDGLGRSEVTTFHPGDSVGLSLVWRADSVPVDDYIAAVFIISPDGQLVLQQDRTPVATFRPTSTWVPGEMVRDNYGFILPADLPPGRYEVWVAMYQWPSLERLPVTSADGEDVGDHVVLVAIDVLPGSEALD